MFKQFLIFLIIFFLGFAFGHSYLTKQNINPNLQLEKNTPESFISEIYDKVKENYWDNISDAQLLELFKLSYEKNGGGVASKFDNKDKMITAIQNAAKSMDEDKKNKFVSAVAASVLASLNPSGRSGLFTTKQEEQLKNIVQNIDPQKDLYKDLGLSKGASPSAIETAFQKKKESLSSDSSIEAQEQLKKLSYAKDVLTQKDSKQNYDQQGVEPTIFSKIIPPSTLYIQFKKFSPTSYDEFVKIFDMHKDNKNLLSLIFDLRGNVGGQIDSSAIYLGHFIGKNQYAFDFYHKGEYLPFKTPTDKLPTITKYKQVVVLVDNNTQSSAEILAASFKKYHAGVVVGSPTKGWGTVERVFQLDNQFDKGTKYSMFLVHSVTLREDNQPIEGRGVEPDINIKTGNWEELLFTYFRNPQLTEAVKEIL